MSNCIHYDHHELDKHNKGIYNANKLSIINGNVAII
jgi:hypothetical protein